MIKGNTPIVFIQGDTFVYQVAFSDRPFETIDKVVFSCDALSINQEMVKDEENKKFVYAFFAEHTAQLLPLQTTFDIIVHYVDGPIESQTGIPLIIKKRQNKKEGSQSPFIVDWSQIRNIPSAVQVITSNSDVTSDDNYNVDKLNHVTFSKGQTYDLDAQSEQIAALEDDMAFATNESIDDLFN